MTILTGIRRKKLEEIDTYWHEVCVIKKQSNLHCASANSPILVEVVWL